MISHDYKKKENYYLPDYDTTRVLNHSIIGLKNDFIGDIYCSGNLRIDGHFKGNIKGYGSVIIGESGMVIGNIYAKNLIVGGRIQGNVYALERVDILSKGILKGDIYTSKCNAEEGMFLLGITRIVDDEEIVNLFKKEVDAYNISEEFNI